MTTYKFSDFTHDGIEDAFGLEQSFSPTPIFEDWKERANLIVVNEMEQNLLKHLCENLRKQVDGWNEQELQIKFISLLIALVNFDMLEYQCNSFAERTLSKKIKGILFHGRVDWMAAKGKREPKQPFFFIHEYKRGIDSSGDPIGQLLSAMFIAQTLNQEPSTGNLFTQVPMTYQDLPMYGCYVIGRHWYFAVLKEQSYYISKPYDTGDLIELQDIFKLLKAQKQLIIERVTQN